MNGDDWYKPKPSPPPPRQPKPRKALWALEKDGHTYRCELLFHEQGGTEAQILKDGELMYGRRFEEGWQTLQWAELEREFIEKAATDVTTGDRSTYWSRGGLASFDNCGAAKKRAIRTQA